MSNVDVDAGRIGEADERTTSGLESIRDRTACPPRVTLFDPRPARLDEAWIEVDASVVVSTRAVR